MKKTLVALLCAIAMTSCSFISVIKNTEKIYEGTDATYDKYPGMNVNEEPLTGTPFALPAGIEIANVFYGENNQRDEENQDESLSITDDMLGSGLCVIVSFDVKNTTGSKITLTLPAGLMLQAGSTEYQNGILVKDVNIEVGANKTRRVSVRFYCLNASAHASDASAAYSFCYITTIPAFRPLFNVCKKKRVNIDEYKSINILKYYSTATLVQEMVWAITQGKNFTEAEIEDYMKKVKKSK